MSFKHKKEEPEDEGWLMTYADTITLLMAFFVILLSLCEPKQEKMEVFGEVISEAMGKEVVKPFSELTSDIQAMITENAMEESMSVEETDRGILIEISSSSFYESGSAEFKKEAIPVLLDLSLILEAFDYEDYAINIGGHTDATPLSGAGMFATNWELSAGRATRVVRFFIEEGLDKERLTARAFADTRPKVPNDDEEGNPIPENQELNRRIEIAVERNGL
jgi:chemotaxis protein MotB